MAPMLRSVDLSRPEYPNHMLFILSEIYRALAWTHPHSPRAVLFVILDIKTIILRSSEEMM